MTDLLNCPFCGGKPAMHDSNMGWKYVICGECDAAADDHTKEEMAALAWNTRTPDHKEVQFEGMTLRDYFAAHAMTGDYLKEMCPDEAADAAYQYADAMLRHREG